MKNQYSTTNKKSLLESNLLICSNYNAESAVYAGFTKDSELIDVSQYSFMALDAEWSWQKLEGGKKADYIKVQCGFSDHTGNVGLVVVFVKTKYPLSSLTEVDGVPVLLVPCDSIDAENLLERFQLPKKLEILMYYSPKDMQGLIGEAIWREMLLTSIAGKKLVNKARRLNVQKFKVANCEVKVTDLIGMFNDSLDNALNSVGIDNPYKSLATDKGRSKDRMDLFALEDADEFLKYAVGDVLYLHKAMILRTKQINKIVTESLGFNPDYNTDTVKKSSGSLVADVFEQWLIKTRPELFKAVLMLTTSNNSKEWAQVRKLRKQVEESIVDFTAINHQIKNKMPSTVHGLAAGSIRAFYPGNYGTGTVTYGAVVHGGRCINERPDRSFIEYVLDIDLSSAYGSALRKFDYPFGLPTVFGREIDDTNMKLGQFLMKNQFELVDGLYVIYVSGNLSFHQDLIHSKYGLDSRKISSQLLSGDFGDFDQNSDFSWEREVETAHIKGDFVLTTKQIEFGVITSDSLEVIRKVSSDRELSEWMNLSVDCSVYYPRSLEVSEDEFISTMMDEKTRGKKTYRNDYRNKKWCKVPLEEFIGKFIGTRKAYKKKMKEYDKGSKEFTEYNLLQNGVKLFVNTTYGCLAAPYFPMGNTVLANCITCKARTGVWMMAKALNTVQSITDGGIYSPEDTRILKTNLSEFKLPGFNSLYLRSGSKWNRYVGRHKLFSNSIIEEIRNVLDSKNIELEGEFQAKLDATATEHINSFWSHYELSMPFEIEHKIANTGFKAGYTGAADYAINTGNSEKIFIKTRGAKDDSHPKKHYLRALVNRTPINEVPHTFVEYKSLGVSQFQERPSEIFLPGDDIEYPVTLKPRKNSGCLYETYEDWKKANDTHNRTVRRYEKDNEGKPLEEWTRFNTIR